MIASILWDACAAIHLHYSGVLDILFELADHTFSIGGIVFEECNGETHVQLQALIDQGGLYLLDDDDLPALVYGQLLEQFHLGEGETECLAFSLQGNYVVCTDDRAARRAAQRLLGDARVTGSLGLLREAVRQGLLDTNDAQQAYQNMRKAGAFLPVIDGQFFDQ